MADDPNRTIELTQLVADLKAVQGSVFYSHLGYTRIAEELYGRGVRSKLQLPGRLAEFAGTWLPVVSDPATGGAKSFGFLRALGDGAGVDVVLALDTKLVPSGFAQMSEVPGHVDVAPAPRRCPWCEWSFDALEDGRIPFHKRSFMSDWMECQGSRHLAEENGGVVVPAAPGPIPDRPLPAGVQRVIQNLATVKAAAGNHPGYRIELKVSELEAVLAEIPDVAPRYPTIWAYEQACRTIRERDTRIEKALELADRVEQQLGDEVPGSLDELRMTLRLRMPRTVPATDEEKSEVTRALELAELPCAGEVLAPDTAISALETLAAEIRRLQTATVSRCPSCDHLADAHVNGTGCFVTVRDVTAGVDSHCPCTFDARSEHGVRQDERGK